MPDLTDREDILREIKDRVEYLYGKPDKTIEVPGQLGGAVEIIKLAYRAATLGG